jgi:hypothetical protein
MSFPPIILKNSSGAADAETIPADRRIQRKEIKGTFEHIFITALLNQAPYIGFKYNPYYYDIITSVSEFFCGKNQLEGYVGK